MVDLKTVIDELNAGKIELIYIDDDCCTTIGEVVVFLKQLAELTEENKRQQSAIKSLEAKIILQMGLIDRQKSEIERLQTEKAKFDNTILYDLEQVNNLVKEAKTDVIKEFAQMFENVLIGMRERYNHSNCCEYGAVCEVVHRQLLRCLKEMEDKS